MCSLTSCWRAPVLGKPGIGAYAINLFSYAINVFPHQLLEAPVLGKQGIGAIAATPTAVWVGGEKGVLLPMPRPDEAATGVYVECVLL